MARFILNMQRIPELPYIFTLNCPSYRFYIVSSSIFNKHITLESAYNYTVLWIQIHKTHAFHQIQLDVHNTYIELQLFFLVAVFFCLSVFEFGRCAHMRQPGPHQSQGSPVLRKTISNLIPSSRHACVWICGATPQQPMVKLLHHSALVFWNMYTTELHVLCTMQ